MFGAQRYITDFDPAPEWAAQLAVDNAKRCVVVWLDQPGGKCVYGCTYIEQRWTGIFSPTREQTPETLMVVLHELAHLTAGRNRELVRGKVSEHGPKFWNVAVGLYAKYGILEYAAKNERYVGGRKACRAALEVAA